MGYDHVKAQIIICMQSNTNLIAKMKKATPNAIKTHKQIQNNALVGSRMPNLKNTIVQKLWFFSAKIGDRALTGGRALTPILNTQNLTLRASKT